MTETSLKVLTNLGLEMLKLTGETTKQEAFQALMTEATESNDWACDKGPYKAKRAWEIVMKSLRMSLKLNQILRVFEKL